MSTLLRLASALGPTRIILFGSVIVTVLAALGWMISQVAAPHYALLFGDLDTGDSARIIQHLETTGVPYRLEAGGTAVFVPGDLVSRTRLTLAEQGVPAGGSLGYEVFDKGSGLGTSTFVQNVNLVRALEGELARTIRSIAAVKNARVHLVLPRRELFSRQRQEPSASVLLETRTGAGLAPTLVVAVQNLVAAAVPGLAPHRIAIVDNRGTLLSETQDQPAVAGLSGGRDEERRLRLERHLAQTVEDLIEKVVGPGKARAEVFAEMDFDRINTSEESYDPEGQVVRSSRSVAESGSNRERDGQEPVSISTNLPGDPGQDQSASTSSSSENRSEDTVNYEISKKTINRVRETGIITKLSVAVLVDGAYQDDGSGGQAYRPRTPEELAQLTNLVRGAIGFDAKRGDTVEIINMQFAAPDVESDPSFELLFGLEKTDLFKIGQLIILGALSLLVILLIVRPLLSRLLDIVSSASQPGAVQVGAQAGARSALSAPGHRPSDTPALLSSDVSADERIDLDQVEGRVKASAVRKVSEIVAKHPEESVAIIRTWLHSED
jgi:flagellar M-ring protein FliF